MFPIWLKLKQVAVLSFAVVSTGMAWSQARYTAERAGDLQVGGEFTGVISRYLPTDTQGYPAPLYSLDFKSKFLGGGAYATFDFRSHYGVELNFRHVLAHGGDDSAQTTYAVGGRYIPVRKWGFVPYGKLMYGRAVYNYPYDRANLAFNMLSYGGGTDYHLIRAINVRAEYEFQQWLSVPLRSPNPNVLSVGVAYHFHGGKLQ